MLILGSFFRRSLWASPLMNPCLTPGPWWVARGKMRVLKGFSRLEMCFKRLSLYTTVSRNVVSAFEILAVTLIVG